MAKPLSAEAKTVLAAAELIATGDRDRALHWYMHAPSSEFDNRTPHELVAQDKARWAEGGYSTSRALHPAPLRAGPLQLHAGAAHAGGGR